MHQSLGSFFASMPIFRLQELDQRTVAVEFPVADYSRVVKGRARLVGTSAAQALHVVVDGLAETLEFVFEIGRFSGSIERGDRFSCDFAIRLQSVAA